MTGKEVVERLNRCLGKRIHIDIGDCVLHGVLETFQKSSISQSYKIGDATFQIFFTAPYEFNAKYEFIGKFLQIRRMQNEE